MIDSMYSTTEREPEAFNCQARNVINSYFAGPERLTDEELMRDFKRAATSEQSCALLDEMFRRYQTRMTHWCLKFTKDREQSVDLAQDVFLKAFEHLHTYRGDSKVSTWLYAIARNHCLGVLRRRRVASVSITESISGTLGDANAIKAFTTVEDEQLLRLIHRAMSTSLDPLEARVITLHYLKGVPLGVITEMLDFLNPSGAKAYVLRARRKLTWALRARGSRLTGMANSRPKRNQPACSSALARQRR